MSYNPSIPNAGDLISVSQQQIKDNFTILNTAFEINHVGLTVANAGKHNACVFPQGSGIATAADEGAIYTKDVGGSPNLYWRRKSSGDQIQMTTNHTPSAAATGYTFLPGGLLMQWGTVSVSTGSSANITFPTAFSVAPYSITANFIRSSTTTVHGLYILNGSVSTTKFQTVSAGTTGNHNIYWMAIGKA